MEQGDLRIPMSSHIRFVHETRNMCVLLVPYCLNNMILRIDVEIDVKKVIEVYVRRAHYKLVV